MSWQDFLRVISVHQEYNLTSSEIEVFMCLDENPSQDKPDLLKHYKNLHGYISDEAFKARLSKIYKKFELNKLYGKGKKLPQLKRLLAEKYLEYKNNNKEALFTEIGLTNIHSNFPDRLFEKQINNIINSESKDEKKLDIWQTFAPNLHNYLGHLIQCLENRVHVRILLAWPYSQAARLREDVLRKYTNSTLPDEINIENSVIENLETLQKVFKQSGKNDFLEIRLYDTLPSLAMYRAGNYMLAGVFLHGILAVNTFQLELNLNSSNQLIANTLQNDFDLVWEASRKFYPLPNTNWRNDLKILFMV